MLQQNSYLSTSGSGWILEQVPQIFPDFSQSRFPKVLDLLAFDLVMLLLLLHLDLLDADLDLRVILDSAARLDQEDVDAPVLHVVAGHDGADVGVQVQVSRSIRVQDGREPGPVPVEEVLCRNIVVGTTVLVSGLKPVAVAKDFFGRGSMDQPEEP